MDLRTGKMYETKEAARAAGVPESDLAEVFDDPHDRSVPEVRFASGPFKNRVYRRDAKGQLIRIDNKPVPASMKG